MNAGSIKQTNREYERLLAAVFGLLLHSGVRQAAISALAARALNSAVRTASSVRYSAGGELVTFSLVLDAWHRDRRYLTSRGRPRALPLFGRAPSVESLIRSQGSAIDPVDLVHRIQSLRLVAQCSRGRYRPVGDTALVSIYGPTVLQHLARSLMFLLETVEGNLKGTPTTAPLLERSAEVPDLPVECVEPFRQFSRMQGAIFMRTINDWLEMRRSRGRIAQEKKSVRAGVHVHAYIASAGAATRHHNR